MLLCSKYQDKPHVHIHFDPLPISDCHSTWLTADWYMEQLLSVSSCHPCRLGWEVTGFWLQPFTTTNPLRGPFIMTSIAMVKAQGEMVHPAKIPISARRCSYFCL